MSDPFSLALAGGTALFNAFSQGSENRKNRKFQQAENQKSRDYNTEMWNKNNEYNTITNQMQRFKDAGVNPHLAYQNGSPMNTSNAPASSNASSMPAGVAPRIESGQILQAMLMKSQIANIDADTKKKEAEAQGQTTLNGINTNELENWANSYDVRIQVQKANISQAYSGIQVNESQVQKNLAEVTKIASENAQIKQYIENLKSQKQLTDENINKILVDISVARTQIQNILANTRYTNEQSKNQSFIRSNIQADTISKTELAKGYNQNNYIQSKYGLSTADAQYNLLNNQGQKVLNEVKTELERKLNFQIDTKQKEFRLLMDQVLAPADVAKGYRDIINPFKKSSTTRYDKNGDYSGESHTVQSR